MEKFDFHIHSTCSDGKKTVSEIVEYAKANNFEYISITDHDNIDSLEEIKKCDLGSLKFIPGVEISTRHNDYNIHMLCYNFKETDNLKRIMERQIEVRANKFIELISQLKDRYQIEFSKEDLELVSKKSNVGKNDIADLLLRYNHVKTRDEAFDKYINTLSSAKVKKIDFLEIVKAAKEDGGILIMAHPYEIKEKYNLSQEELYELIDSLIENGCDGIEAYHSEYDYEDCQKLYNYAKEKNLVTTAGSDFHRECENEHEGMGFLYKYAGKDEKIEDLNIFEIFSSEKN
jgi:predicted metal-dependent phosphoesterase TrpH